MRWTPGGMSSDVEDRRGSSGGGGGRLGIVGFVVLLVISLITGRNYLGSYLSGSGGSPTASTSGAPPVTSPEEERSAQLVSFVLDDAQQTWTTLLGQEGVNYPHAKLVLFRDYTSSGCGAAQSATGPFYCPADQKVYIDLGFWDDLRKYGASGDFAQSYVIAHELGHHVQNVLGIERKVRYLQQQNPSARNPLSVALELQADCFAGVWAHSTAQRQIIDTSDVQSGLNAAAAVGDDHLQKMAGRYVSPESFTHGSSAQRSAWFTRGLKSGDVQACNTFSSSGNDSQ
jgi:uncharacterized protein